ncbi:MAG: hypothetical protein K2X35_08840 [Bryobacteraceae bacterium]|nr:hypothetical protein [Bryobacteraceae bacterium]
MAMQRRISIVGGGPAGSAAAIAAALRGADARLHEQSAFPRHKVCGEFLSAEIEPALDRLGIRAGFLDHAPARVRTLRLYFGKTRKSAPLPEAGHGLSRYLLDDLLRRRALDLGVSWTRERAAQPTGAAVIASGRAAPAAPGDRLFGFKAHFTGPPDDAVELFFFPGGYVGINCVEQGRTNVCGLARESALRRFAFQYDELLNATAAIRERLAPLRREMDWLSTGPLVFGNRFGSPAPPETFLAGDALSFVDPFTGSGLLVAIRTGELAGASAAEDRPVAGYMAAAAGIIGRPFRFSSLLRDAVRWGELLVPWIPSSLLYRITRPRAG